MDSIQYTYGHDSVFIEQSAGFELGSPLSIMSCIDCATK